LGAHNISNESEKSAQRFKVNQTEMITHKDFDLENGSNDIGLVKILQGIVFNEFVQAVPLAIESWSFAGFMVKHEGLMSSE
jgi:hypothetical protein